MSNQTCGQCKHFKPYISLKSGVILKKEEGSCGWTMEAKLPMNFISYGDRFDKADLTDLFRRRFRTTPILHDTNASKCQCFEKLNKK